MGKRLKELHKVMDGAERGPETPFGHHEKFPSEKELQDFFKKCHEEFPDYRYFDFECELVCFPDQSCSYQWYLVGDDR